MSKTEQQLGELLSMLHGDGGHYQDAHGTDKACEDAATKYYALLKKIDALEHPHYCTICGSPAEWISDEGVWRHRGGPFDEDGCMASFFCDKYGYPISVRH